MITIKKGTTRIAILIGGVAIKIPNFTFSMQNFLTGCLANCNERKFCKDYRNMSQINLVAYTYFSSWFGLINIQRRVKVFNISCDRHLWVNHNGKFDGICSDIKDGNFGFDWKGEFVCLDYAV